MFADTADVYSGGDAAGIPTTTIVQKVPKTQVPNQPQPANLLVGLAGLVVGLALWHKFHRGKRS